MDNLSITNVFTPENGTHSQIKGKSMGAPRFELDQPPQTGIEYEKV
jgi:hypothetical protein